MFRWSQTQAIESVMGKGPIERRWKGSTASQSDKGHFYVFPVRSGVIVREGGVTLFVLFSFFELKEIVLIGEDDGIDDSHEGDDGCNLAETHIPLGADDAVLVAIHSLGASYQ